MPSYLQADRLACSQTLTHQTTSFAASYSSERACLLDPFQCSSTEMPGWFQLHSLVPKGCLNAGGSPSLGAPFSSGPAPAFGAGAFGGGASGPSQNPNPFQPAPFTAAAAGGGFGQQQSAPMGFGATNTAGTCARHHVCLVNVQPNNFDQFWSFQSLPSMIRLYALPDICTACMPISCHVVDLHLAMQADMSGGCKIIVSQVSYPFVCRQHLLWGIPRVWSISRIRAAACGHSAGRYGNAVCPYHNQHQLFYCGCCRNVVLLAEYIGLPAYIAAA